MTAVQSKYAVGFYYQPNNSGDNGRKPGAFGIHSIECPPAIKQPGNGWYGRKYASLMGPDYLQNPAQQHSVQYGVFGDVLIQGLWESWWAWGMGTPASKYTTHVEQAGYASFTEAQWRGLPSAIGSTYVRAGDGVAATFTAADAEAMSSQFDLMAKFYADWCHRNGYVPKRGTIDQLAQTCSGAELGIQFTHAMASQLPRTTTTHTDPGSNYPVQLLVDNAMKYYLGGNTPPTPDPEPTDPDWTFAMTLPGAPSTYAQFVKDQVNEQALYWQQVYADKLGVAHGVGVAANRVKHSQNYDGTKEGK